jgi:hypothetical protein
VSTIHFANWLQALLLLYIGTSEQMYR